MCGSSMCTTPSFRVRTSYRRSAVSMRTPPCSAPGRKMCPMEQSGRQRCKRAPLRHRVPQAVRLSNPADSRCPDPITLHPWQWRPGMAELRQTRGGPSLCVGPIDSQVGHRRTIRRSQTGLLVHATMNRRNSMSPRWVRLGDGSDWRAR